MTADSNDAQGAFSDAVYVAANSAHYASWFDLPELPNNGQWSIRFNTGDMDRPVLNTESAFADSGILVGERSVVIFSARL